MTQQGMPCAAAPDDRSKQQHRYRVLFMVDATSWLIHHPSVIRGFQCRKLPVARERSSACRG